MFHMSHLMTSCLDDEDPSHAVIFKKQQVFRRGPHKYVFLEHFYHRYFDFKFNRQKCGWAVGQLNHDCIGTELYLKLLYI